MVAEVMCINRLQNVLPSQAQPSHHAAKQCPLLTHSPLRHTHQHVLGQPALLIGQRGGDPEGKALLSKQRISTVAAAKRPNLIPLGEVGNGDALWIAGPKVVIFLSWLQRLPNRMDTPEIEQRDKENISMSPLPL